MKPLWRPTVVADGTFLTPCPALFIITPYRSVYPSYLTITVTISYLAAKQTSNKWAMYWYRSSMNNCIYNNNFILNTIQCELFILHPLPRCLRPRLPLAVGCWMCAPPPWAVSALGSLRCQTSPCPCSVWWSPGLLGMIPWRHPSHMHGPSNATSKTTQWGSHSSCMPATQSQQREQIKQGWMLKSDHILSISGIMLKPFFVCKVRPLTIYITYGH